MFVWVFVGTPEALWVLPEAFWVYLRGRRFTWGWVDLFETFKVYLRLCRFTYGLVDLHETFKIYLRLCRLTWGFVITSGFEGLPEALEVSLRLFMFTWGFVSWCARDVGHLVAQVGIIARVGSALRLKKQLENGIPLYYIYYIHIIIYQKVVIQISDTII